MTHQQRAADAARSFAGRRVAITGGTAGLGLALVREFLDRGADVAFVARRADGVVRAAQEFPRAHGIIGDVASKEDIHRIALQILGALGGVDVLVNNASDLGPVPLRLLADTECEDFERALTTNVLGPFRLTKALLGSLAANARENGGAAVVNISSDAAVTPYARWGAYGASKAALQHMTHIWDQELTDTSVKVICLDPGDMDTAMHAAALPDADRSALKRPEVAAREVADAVAAALPAAELPMPAAPAAALQAAGSPMPAAPAAALQAAGSPMPAAPAAALQAAGSPMPAAPAAALQAAGSPMPAAPAAALQAAGSPMPAAPAAVLRPSALAAASAAAAHRPVSTLERAEETT